jgi:hypothetical protein
VAAVRGQFDATSLCKALCDVQIGAGYYLSRDYLEALDADPESVAARLEQGYAILTSGRPTTWTE